MEKIIKDKQDLTYLKWSHTRNSSGTAGTFLKSETTKNGKKTYYKMSQYDSERGIVGHECINEIIVDRLLDILRIEHLSYQLIHADVEVDGTVYDTYICASENFRKPGERKAALEDYYQVNRYKDESRYDFCIRNGWEEYINKMLVVDYLILNRDRHGANIEVLGDARKHTIRIAPLFDHGLSFLFSCMNEEDIENYDIYEDKPCNNFIGGKSTKENLDYVTNLKGVFVKIQLANYRDYLFSGLDDIVSTKHQDKIWNMLINRWKYYENLCDKR